MIKTTFRWRPHTETPVRIGETAIIAYPPNENDDPGEGALLLFGIYSWNGKQWAQEVTGVDPQKEIFWWASEKDLLSKLDAIVAKGQP